MGVLLQAHFKRATPAGNVTVPAPVDGDASVPWWWDKLAAQASELRLAGFSAVLLPPALKTSAGASPAADGYGTFDDYDLGSKNQFFSLSTRFGSREQLQRCVAVLRANGLDIYLDLVQHQRDGGRDGVYRYLGADGHSSNGLFPKDPSCFFGTAPGWRPRDPVAGPVSTDFGFGDELCPINALPPGYVMNGLIDAADWQTRALDAQGCRIDDTKGMAVEAVSRFLGSKAMTNRFAVGEYFDTNPDTLNGWVWNSGMNGRSSTFDFALRDALQAMCNNASNWDMRQLQGRGLIARSPMNAVTFVENHDTDLSWPVIWNKPLGYAFILTAEGYPCVYFRDYATDTNCYGLKPVIDNLIWIHENLACGGSVTRWADFQAYVFERTGPPGLLIGLNNDRWNGWRTLTVDTGFGPDVTLHDYTGHTGDIRTDGQGRATVSIPPNDNGLGYVCYARAGLGQPFTATTLPVSQDFDGAADLDIGPATNGAKLQVGRVWCVAGSVVSARLAPDTTGWNAASSATLRLSGPDGATLATQTAQRDAASSLHVTASHDGWHRAEITGAQLPPTGSPFRLSLTYTSTRTLPP
jgi:alpha-amylase